MVRPRFDPVEVLAAWRREGDHERAVFMARGLFNEALRGTDDSMSTRLYKVRHAVEAIFDGPGSAPRLVAQGMDGLAKEWRFQEAVFPTTSRERTRMRAEIELYRARALHCAREHRRALEHCVAAHNLIEVEAGGRVALHAALASPEPSEVAELLVAILGITAAALKRTFPVTSITRLQWLAEIRELTDSYLAGIELAPANVYPGAPSLVQIMYLLCEHGDPVDAMRVELLRALDIRVRPDDHRARATIPLRELAYARYCGDRAGIALVIPKVLSSLQGHDLERHLGVVAGWRCAS